MQNFVEQIEPLVPFEHTSYMQRLRIDENNWRWIAEEWEIEFFINYSKASTVFTRDKD